jgi:hypothetical protein
MATKLAPGEISDLDPHKFMAVIGKRVTHSASPEHMAMPVCAYSCVIDAINAAVVNAEACAPMYGPQDVRVSHGRRRRQVAYSGCR